MARPLQVSESRVPAPASRRTPIDRDSGCDVLQAHAGAVEQGDGPIVGPAGPGTGQDLAQACMYVRAGDGAGFERMVQVTDLRGLLQESTTARLAA